MGTIGRSRGGTSPPCRKTVARRWSVSTVVAEAGASTPAQSSGHPVVSRRRRSRCHRRGSPRRGPHLVADLGARASRCRIPRGEVRLHAAHLLTHRTDPRRPSKLPPPNPRREKHSTISRPCAPAPRSPKLPSEPPGVTPPHGPGEITVGQAQTSQMHPRRHQPAAETMLSCADDERLSLLDEPRELRCS